MLKRSLKGYTLIELIIVVVIISILGTLMMLSFGSYNATVKADKIIKNMIAIKMAAGMYHLENPALFDENPDQPKDPITLMAMSKYLQVAQLSDYDDYDLAYHSRKNTTAKQGWYVRYKKFGDASYELKSEIDNLNNENNIGMMSCPKDRIGSANGKIRINDANDIYLIMKVR